MALGTVLIIGGVALAAFGKKKAPKKSSSKKKLNQAPPTPPKEEPIVRWEAEEWFLPEGWLEDYATPRMREYVFEAFQASDRQPVPAPEIDALDIALYLLDGQTSAFQLPPSAHPPEGEMWQTDVSNAVNYYDGPESVLGLLYHIAEYVEDGLGRWQAGDDLYLTDFQEAA